MHRKNIKEEAKAHLGREMIIDALKNTRGKSTRAADLLKTIECKFNYKAKLYGIDFGIAVTKPCFPHTVERRIPNFCSWVTNFDIPPSSSCDSAGT